MESFVLAPIIVTIAFVYKIWRYRLFWAPMPPEKVLESHTTC